MKFTNTIALATLLAFSGAAFAQTAAPATAPAKPAVTAPPAAAAPATATTAKPAATDKKAAKKERTEKSVACSAQADEKKLHGKERKKFRKTCMKG